MSPNETALATLEVFGGRGTDPETMLLFFCAAIGAHEYGADRALDATARAERSLAFGKSVVERLDYRKAFDRIVSGELRGEALAALKAAFARGDGAAGHQATGHFVLDLSAQNLPAALDAVARVAIGFVIVASWEDYRHAAASKPWLRYGINGPMPPSAWLTERAILLLMQICGRMWKPAVLHPATPGGRFHDQVRSAIRQALERAIAGDQPQSSECAGDGGLALADQRKD